HGGSGTRVSISGASDSDRARLTAATALQHGDLDFLIAGAARRASEIEVAGLTPDNPRDRLDRDHHAVLARSGLATGFGRLRLTLDGMRETRDADIRAMLGRDRLVFTEQLLGDDRRHQWRVLLDQDLMPLGPISRGQWRIWHQLADIAQET